MRSNSSAAYREISLCSIFAFRLCAGDRVQPAARDKLKGSILLTSSGFSIKSDRISDCHLITMLTSGVRVKGTPRNIAGRSYTTTQDAFLLMNRPLSFSTSSTPSPLIGTRADRVGVIAVALSSNAFLQIGMRWRIASESANIFAYSNTKMSLVLVFQAACPKAGREESMGGNHDVGRSQHIAYLAQVSARRGLVWHECAADGNERRSWLCGQDPIWKHAGWQSRRSLHADQRRGRIRQVHCLWRYHHCNQRARPLGQAR